MDHGLWWRKEDFSSSDSRPCRCCVHLHSTVAMLILWFSRRLRLLLRGHGWPNFCSSCVRLFELQNTVVEVLPFYPATWTSSRLLFPPLFFFFFFMKTINTHSLSSNKSQPEVGFPWRSPSVTCLVLPQPLGGGLNRVLVRSCIFAHLQNKLCKWKSADSAFCFLHFPPRGLLWLLGAWDMAKVMLKRNMFSLA